jgi:hypothetical protein
MYTLINRNAKAVVGSIDAGFVPEYEWLVEKVVALPSDDFRRRYRVFWSMNQSQLSLRFFETYFKVLTGSLNQPPPIEFILKSLYGASTRKNGRQSVEFSFTTKLLHMTDQHLPVYDSQIAEFYFFQAPAGTGYEERIAKLTQFYEFLKNEYARILENGLLKTSIEEFRQNFPTNKFTEEKIVDSLIWAFVKLLRDGQIIYE